MNHRLAFGLFAILAIAGATALWLAQPPDEHASTDPGETEVHLPVPILDEKPALLSNPTPLARATASSEAETPRVPDVAVLVQARTGLLFIQGAPVPSVEVAVGLGDFSDPDPPAYARGRTDERGEARIELPMGDVEARRDKPDGRLWARVVEPGYQHRTYFTRLNGKTPPLVIQVLATRGVTLRGRLVDEQGTEIAARASARKPGDRFPTGVSGFPPPPPGTFELHLPEPGVFDLLAESDEHGSGSLLGVRVSAENPPTDLEIVVRGPGVVRGRVRDAAGRPSAGVGLFVLAAQADDGTGFPVGDDPVARRLRFEGRGRAFANATTDADGVFSVRGLRDDRFHVRAKSNGQERHPLLLTPTAVLSDGTPLDLILDRPHLVVRIGDKPWSHLIRFEPVSDPPPEWHAVPAPRQTPGSWVATVLVAVTPVRSEFRPDDHERVFLAGHPLGNTEFVFEVEPGHRYLVGLLGGPCRWRPVEVEIPVGVTRVETTIEVEDDVPRGTLAVSVLTADGKELKSSVSIRLADPGSGLPLLATENLKGPWPLRLEVPEGEYRVLVDGAPSLDFFHGVLWGPRSFGRYAETVTVAADAVAEVLARLPLGARVNLTLNGVARQDDVDTLRKRHPGPNEEYVQEWSSRASVSLIPEDGWPEPVMFTIELRGSSAAGTHLTGTAPIGAVSLSQVLPAGRFRLEARMPGGRASSSDVVLVDGQTTDLTLELGP